MANYVFYIIYDDELELEFDYYDEEWWLYIHDKVGFYLLLI